METLNKTSPDNQSDTLLFDACSYWLRVFARALSEHLPGVVVMTVLGFPWLVSHWIKIKLQPESHQEKVNPFIYTMQ